MAFEILPFWWFTYFPSQDGIAHLYNAQVIVNYAAEPAFSKHYTLTLLHPAGNALTHLLLAGLLLLFSPLVALKVFLSLYVIFFFSAVRYFLSALTRHAAELSICAAVFAGNALLYLGFWNFCFGAAAGLFMIGYWLRRQEAGRRIPWWGQAAMSSGVYLFHVLPWAVCAGVILMSRLPALGPRALADRDSAGAVRRWAGSALLELREISGLLLPAIPALAYSVGTPARQGVFQDPDLAGRLWSLYSLRFLHILGTPSDFLPQKLILATLLVAAVSGCFAFSRKLKADWRGTPLLAAAIVLGFVAWLGPDRIGPGTYVRTRVAFLAAIIFIGWLARSPFPIPPLIVRSLAATWACLAIFIVAAAFQPLAEWDQRLAELTTASRWIQPDSTLLLANLSQPRPQSGLVPLAFAAGLIPARGMIDLRNYEANTDHFPVRFRDDYRPSPALGTVRELASTPPRFDISRYEQVTRGRVDYILFLDSAERNGSEMRQLIDSLYGPQLTLYEETARFHGRHLGLHLYRRRAQSPPE